MDDVKVIGMDEVLKKLKLLPERIQKNILVGAIRASANPIIDEARSLVPKDKGVLKKSIGKVKRKTNDKNIVHFSVAPLKKKGGWYAHFLEFGTVKMAASPFLRPAFEKKGKETISEAKKYMEARIDKEIAKL